MVKTAVLTLPKCQVVVNGFRLISLILFKRALKPRGSKCELNCSTWCLALYSESPACQLYTIHKHLAITVRSSVPFIRLRKSKSAFLVKFNRSSLQFTSARNCFTRRKGRLQTEMTDTVYAFPERNTVVKQYALLKPNLNWNPEIVVIAASVQLQTGL